MSVSCNAEKPRNSYPCPEYLVQEAQQSEEGISGAVMSGRGQGYAKEPEEALPIKPIAKELFPTGERTPGQAHDWVKCFI
jgi:hypothetical protein